MFKLLVVFFALNLLYSIWRFKILINPASIFGLGFAIAGFMCLYFYDEWLLQSFNTETFNVFVIGTILFTGTCALLRLHKNGYISKENVDNQPIESIYSKRIFTLLGIVVIIQLFVCYYKIKIMTMTYGNSLSFSELVYTAHMDAREGEELYPWWFFQIDSAIVNIAPFLFLILGVVVARNAFKGKWLVFIVAFVLSNFVNSALDGSKGGAIQSVIMLILAITLKYVRIKRRLNIPKKVLAIIASVGIVIFLGINAMNYFLGRGDENNTMDVAMYAGAVYCGAELKNMDLYINHPKKVDVWGENTFRQLYKKLDQFELIKYKEKKYSSGALKPFVFIHEQFLGNVYTLFCDLYWDFGFWGILWMPVMAIILMLFYNRIFTSSKSLTQVSIWEFFYITMAWHTFMSFFSNRFFEAYCNPFLILKALIYFYLMNYIFQRWIYIPKKEKASKLLHLICQSTKLKQFFLKRLNYE